MSLKSKINTDYIVAFKGKDSIGKSILSVVKGEIQTQEKNLNVPDLDDTEVLKILTKIVKSLNETISKSNDNESKLQLIALSQYMPKQMSYQDIKDKMEDLLEEKGSPLTIGEVMKAFSKDTVDRKLVSQVFEEN
jgi:uncharacterized protein YqeY